MNIPHHLTKLYYSMGEVSSMFGVNQSLLRYWDKEFPSLKPKKNRKGDRRFTKEDINELQRIYNLVKERGFTIEGARKELVQNKTSSQSPINNNESSPSSLLLRLSALREDILHLKCNLNNISNKL